MQNYTENVVSPICQIYLKSIRISTMVNIIFFVFSDCVCIDDALYIPSSFHVKQMMESKIHPLF